MNFKDCKDLKRGIVLVNGEIERYFHGFNNAETEVITERVSCGAIMTWDEYEIKNWTIKKPEPKKLGEVAYVISTDGGTYLIEEVGIKGFEIYEVEND